MSENNTIFKLDEAIAFSKLLSNTQQNFPTPRKQSSVFIDINEAKFIPSLGDKKLFIEAIARSGTDSSTEYKVTVELQDVEFVPSRTTTSISPIKAPDGSVYKIKNPNPLNQPAKVNCTCLDFYYMFAVWNFKNDALTGDKPPPPYQKTTDSAPRNPKQLPGACKHIIQLFEQLRKNLYSA